MIFKLRLATELFLWPRLRGLAYPYTAPVDAAAILYGTFPANALRPTFVSCTRVIVELKQTDREF